MHKIVLATAVIGYWIQELSFAKAQEQKDQGFPEQFSQEKILTEENISYLVTDFKCTGIPDSKLASIFFPSDKRLQELATQQEEKNACENIFEFYGIKRYNAISTADIETLSLKLTYSKEFDEVDLKLLPTSVKGQIIISADFKRKSNYVFTIDNNFSLFERGNALENILTFDVLNRNLMPLIKINGGLVMNYLQVKDYFKTNIGTKEVRDSRDITGVSQNHIYALWPYFQFGITMEHNLDFVGDMKFVIDNDGNKSKIFYKKDFQFFLTYHKSWWFGLANLSISPGIRFYNEDYNLFSFFGDPRRKNTFENLAYNEEMDAQLASEKIAQRIAYQDIWARAGIGEPPPDLPQAIVDFKNMYDAVNQTFGAAKELYGYKLGFKYGNDNSPLSLGFLEENFTNLKEKRYFDNRISARSNLGEFSTRLNGLYLSGTFRYLLQQYIVLPTDRNRVGNRISKCVKDLTLGQKWMNKERFYDISGTLGLENITPLGRGVIITEKGNLLLKNNAIQNDSAFIGVKYKLQFDNLNLNLGAKYYLNRMF